jgi:acyl-CoA synthetase (NDP forming)
MKPQAEGNLDRLFNPRSIAVVGASADSSRVSGQPFANLRAHDYSGRLYPVNPKHLEVDGVTCYPAVAALPECPDLAIVAVNSQHVPQVLRDCGEFGVPFVLILSSGFAETGEPGAELQQEIERIARRYGIGIVGPNCQGMMNVTDGVFAGFGAAFQIPNILPGPVSLVTQSGGFGYAVVSMADEAGVGFHHVVCTGNEAGISTLDFIRYFIADPATRIVAGYVEGLKDARRLLTIGDQALAAGKPIMIWKVGKSEAGQRAALSHTANLGGSNELYRALFQQRGILEVDDVQDLADYSRAFLSGRAPQGPRVGIVTISGGGGVVMADLCSEFGLRTPALSDESAAKLREVLPSFGSVENPVDVTGNIFNDPAVLARVLRVVGEDRNIDTLVVMTALVQGKLLLAFAEEIVSLSRALDKPIILCASARENSASAAYAVLDAELIPRYPTPVRAARALHAMVAFADAKRKHAARGRMQLAAAETAKFAKLLDGAEGTLTEHRTKEVLVHAGIRVTRERIARTRDEAVRIAAEIGHPVALKVSSTHIPHKTECQGVRLDLRTGATIAAAYDDIMRSTRSFNPAANIEGILVQEMVENGVETIVGVTNDPRFGPAIMFGLGGIFTDILKDCAFRICPIDREEALDMIRETRGCALLEGARGAPRADIAALADVLERVSTLAIALQDSLAELDINPLFVLPEQNGVVAADALMLLRSPDERHGERAPTIRTFA